MNEPIRHHYVPVFYLSRWRNSDGRICRFSRPYDGKIKVDRVVPKGTAFEPRLYETPGLPPEQAQTMEKDFMAKIDDDAAKALMSLENGIPGKGLTSAVRDSWSRFLVTQMFRAPRDIAQLKSSVEQEWSKESPALRESYAARRSSNDPATLKEYLTHLDPAYPDEFALGIARMLMRHPGICRLLDEMHWHVLDVAQECNPLLTSDNPVWMTSTLVKDEDFLVVAIGPRKLFAAAVKSDTLCRFQDQRREELVKNINKITVQHADRFVYGLTEDALPLVQVHMSTRHHSTWPERLAAIRGHGIVSSAGPLTQI